MISRINLLVIIKKNRLDVLLVIHEPYIAFLIPFQESLIGIPH